MHTQKVVQIKYVQINITTAKEITQHILKLIIDISCSFSIFSLLCMEALPQPHPQ